MLSLTVNFFSLPNLHKGLHTDQRSDCPCLSFTLEQGKCLGPAEWETTLWRTRWPQPSGLQLPLRSEPDCLPVHPLTVRCSRPGTPKIPSQLPVTVESAPCSSEEGAGRRGSLQSPLMLSTSSNLTYFSFLLLCFVSGKHYFLWQFLAVDKCPVILIRRRSWRLLAQCSNFVA